MATTPPPPSSPLSPTSTDAGLSGASQPPFSVEDDALFAEVSAALAPRIQVASLLGRGGMALVFLGRDPLLKRSIAIKVLAPAYAGSEVARARFTREAQAAATMSHPHVAAVYDVGILPSGTPYFLMQFVDGTSLAHVVESDGMVSEARARRVIGEVASALAAAHARGLVHRDVKPGNIMIDAESKRAIVLDFGISAALDPMTFGGEGTLTAIGTYVGTPRYTSPEQASSDKVSGKSDVYSLGVVAFEMLAGRAPFLDTTPMALLAAHIKDAPPAVRTLRPDVDASFAALVDRCLAKDPAARPDASEIASFLVPEPQTAIEWPPPGLDELRGLGARTAGAFNWIGALVAFFVLMLATQPTRGTPAWPAFESSILWSTIANIDGGNRQLFNTPDATPMWLLVLGAALFAGAIVFVVFAARTARLFSAMRRGRAQGYPLPVLLAVAADDADDTALLLNRTGHFAMLKPEQQRALVRARRNRVAALPLGFAITMLFAIAWSLGPLPRAYSVELLSPMRAVILLLPTVAGIVSALYFVVLELRLRGGPLWRRSSQGGAQARREFSRDWLMRATGAARVPVRMSPAAFAAPIVGLMLGLAALFAMYALAATLEQSSHVVTETRGAAGDQFVDFNWTVNRRKLDTALAALTRDFKATHSDSGAARLIAAGLLTSQLHYATSDSSFPDTTPFGALARQALAQLAPDVQRKPPLWREAYKMSLYRIASGILPNDIPPAELANTAASGWGAIWRRFARSSAETPPFFYATPELLMERAQGLYIGSWQMPGEAAVVAQFMVFASTGRWREARAIGEEFAHAATKVLASPMIEEAGDGLQLADVSMTLLNEVARATNDASLARAVASARGASALLHRVQYVDVGRHWLKLWAFAGDVSDASQAPRLVGDARLRPSERWFGVAAIVTAYCMNAREILFGVSPARRSMLDSAARLAADIPRTKEWVDAQRQQLERWIESPREALALSVDVDRKGTRSNLVAWLGFGDLNARMSYCARRQYRY